MTGTLRWVLVCRNRELSRAWRAHFATVPEVEIVEGDITTFECDAIVSPANSFGFMDGGLDDKLTRRFGLALQERVQAEIARRPLRELLVGEALVVPTGCGQTPWLIVAPTMRVPMRLRQSVSAYLAMKAILCAAISHREAPPIQRIAVPGLGTGVGRLDFETCARQMHAAYSEIVMGTPSYPKDFAEAQHRHVDLNPGEIDLSSP